MTTAAEWKLRIEEACAEPDPARCNERITLLHFSLSEALADALGSDAGPNFHSWAVWGSRKAGVTIRQEDLGDAIRNATITAGLCGLALGLATGFVCGRLLHWHSGLANGALGALLGSFLGGATGRQIAIWSRAKAARLVLEGNRTVLEDIGEQSARFLDLLQSGASSADREGFFAGLRAGPSERSGQDRLATAFQNYLEAFDTQDPALKREAMITGNSAIVFHEHIRLEPYIRGAMPFIVRRCATQRMMTYEIGDTVLTVGEDVPGIATPTAANDWTKIEERMRYVFALFRKYHDAPGVLLAPFPDR
ncbi:hypothetical protein SAMN05421819_3686 [Bryocella elongata]|uniref:Uncharacterized protein n=1 Tax=Bryocella elongata TaxID=863522 RepID=A0A1H6BG89_9BACT|nr:hypothetical protein [Bryocella elongata]SEG59773.1 hypothetical protein SAMN05421819_3686 [Bryocella elongata]